MFIQTLSPVFQSDFEQKASGQQECGKTKRTMSVAITTAEGLKKRETHYNIRQFHKGKKPEKVYRQNAGGFGA